ncbi:MAG: hypothetical protein CMF31_05450 [Kordiimonas sp.]|nr:hypothetical protein [Kordiimonas sp.]
MLNKILNRLQGKQDTSPISYEKARGILENRAETEKITLAQHPETQPEILYYLATDDAKDVRQHIAANPATPIQADQILADDSSEDVRAELARKIARLVPDLTREEQITVREKAIEILESLAKDQMPRVRRIIAEELKSSHNAPRHIIRQLAQDMELVVCAPVLQYSPLLSESDLKEIIAATTVTGALSAIAKRADVTESLADAIAGSLDIPAVASLLANPNAQIREDTLDMIIDHAPEATQWHDPLAKRPNLSVRAIKRIAGFVASSLIDIMVQNNKLSTEVADELLRNVRQRIQDESISADDEETLAKQAQDLHSKGALDDEFITNAAQNKQRELLCQCLAQMTSFSVSSVRQILSSRKGARITALTWKAGLNMRTALVLQTDLAHVPPENFLSAKGGSDYPMSVQEMEYELALYE